MYQPKHTPFVFVFFIVALLSSYATAFAQERVTYYVVVGAYAKLDNAKRAVARAIKNNYKAQYNLNSANKLNYVYLLSTVDKREAFAYAVKLRVESEYRDAWVYSGSLGEPIVVAKEPVVEIKPAETPTPEPVKPEPVITIAEEPKVDSAAIVKPEPPKEVKKPTGKPFYFKLVDKDGKDVSGDVQLQESANATEYVGAKSGEIVYLNPPKNKKGSYSVTIQAPGYKQSSSVFNYAKPIAEKGPDNEAIITITVMKARKGDYVDFNKVHFFKNASVLQPESKNELDGLVDLMKENAKYKIKIHGHVNGKQTRESYTMGTSTNFFAMDPSTNKKETISSKALSLSRAETVKAYLVSQGIDASRISTKGEGGVIPLYPEGGTLGQYNDRIEVEILKG